MMFFRKKKESISTRNIEKYSSKKTKNGESGFTMVEVIFALTILLIALLGVFVTFTYSINYNQGNASRAQALAVLQQEVEQLRGKKFTSNFTDTELYGGVKPVKAVTSIDGKRFNIEIKIDNKPSTPDIYEDETVTTTIKQISLTVRLAGPTPGWQTAVPATVILQKVRAN